ncbi:organic hydroperoxide resistance protein [Citricoccus sp. NPDC079358]|uniref:organic hydroperoxide resistance protein n=1 Tax=Citricoccus sp. NPDC079358 TaxID=3154653 RepID=UPI00344E2009
MQTIYTAEALATGGGRDGHTRTADGTISLDLAVPQEMGGSGDGANPEQLFAAGYAACFHSALQMVARKAKADLGESSVGARVGIGPNDAGGFGLEVTLEVVVPNLPAAQAQELADQAHQVCPYSNATRGNIDVHVNVVQD